MLVRPFGTVVSKERSFPDVVKSVPVSNEKNAVTNALISTFGPSGPLVTNKRVEKIVYTKGVNRNRSRANMCLHTKQTTDYSGDVSSYSRQSWPSHSSYFENYAIHPVSSTAHDFAIVAAKDALGVTLGPSFLNGGGQGIINSVARDMAPNLTEVSLPNFLIELGQLKDLFRFWSSDKNLAKNLAGAHLNYKFGWRPTFGDVKGMVNSVKNLQSKLAAFENSLNVLFHKHKRVSSDVISKSGSFVLPGETYHTCVWNCSLVQTVDAHVVYAPQPLAVIGNADKVLRGLIDSLGIELNPRIVWDAIPFTFVVDWFFGVGKWLENFKVDALELPVKYVDSYLQYKQQLSIESCTYLNKGNPDITPAALSGGWITHDDFFHRMVLFPDFATLSGLGWRYPTLNQASLLISLATVLK